MEVSFQELKCKQVINTVDGKCLGHISDIVFDVATAKTLGFVVPNNSGGFLSFFKSSKELFIPFDCVCKIGVDVILVELYINEGPKPKGKTKTYSNNEVVLQHAYSKPQNMVEQNKNN